ncbi:cysteinyl-tRNA synthetase [Basidiobolus ranarum]|uniref:Cysteinyl-tRNA synthetase n=1 Tax=Basidiobolus ranarum TaxID=34480 RepID=A0ABR2VU47_9FUNG
MDNNHFVSIPASVCSLLKLKYFSCTDNQLASLPLDLARLQELEMIDVHNNNLKSLPTQIWWCSKLTSLNVSSNILETFPHPTLAPTSFPNETDTKLDEEQDIQNIPPPLSLCLRNLYLGDNRLTDEIFLPISFLTELRVLNVSFNDIYDIPPNSLFDLVNLVELYISGNQLSSLPIDEIERLRNLKVFHLNGNKLQTLPAELGKIRHLQVLDVGSNNLKYNITNWPYDWNWNYNLELKYLNLSGNKRLEIRNNLTEFDRNRERNLTDFSALSDLRVLGLMDVTLMVGVPEETISRRIRTSTSEANRMGYGMADSLGPCGRLCAWDLAVPRFRGSDKEFLFGLFDARNIEDGGCKFSQYLNDWFAFHFDTELKKLPGNDMVENALRRTFLSLEKELGAIAISEGKKGGATAVVAYINDHTLYVANVGDTLAVVSRGGRARLISMKHIPWNPEEINRIRDTAGYISSDGLIGGKLDVSRGFGFFPFLPAMNANPSIEKIQLSEQDEFIIMASKGLWDHISYQTAVDIARTSRNDLLVAAQKLRDFAIAYGARVNIVVMVIGVRDLFKKKSKPGNRYYNHTTGGGLFGFADDGDETNQGFKKNRRGKEELPGDSTLARLGREVQPPVGQVALVFTDIKNSTFLWETMPEAMQSAIGMHNLIMRRLLRNIGGYEVKTEGDAFMVSFPTVTSALFWCLNVQIQLLQADWPQTILECEDGREVFGPGLTNELLYRGLSVRMGIHWGSPVCEADPITQRMDYFGPMVNRAARICNCADGGQIFVSSDVVTAIKEVMETDDTFEEDHPDKSPGPQLASDELALQRLGIFIVEVGEQKLKGLENPEVLSMIFPKILSGRIEFWKKTQNPTVQIYEPNMSQTIDPSLVRSLGYICLRLERIAADNMILSSRRTSRLYYLNGLLASHIQDNADDQELLRIMEGLISRIENAFSTIYLEKIRPVANIIDEVLGSHDNDFSLLDLEQLKLVLRAYQAALCPVSTHLSAYPDDGL